MNNLPNRFEQHLTANHRVTPKTLRNYRSDLNHFTKWAEKTLDTTGLESFWDQVLKNLTPHLVHNYKIHQLNEESSESTINRRLSTLRNFAKFLVAEGVLEKDPTSIVENITKKETVEEKLEKMMKDFEKHLLSQGLKHATKKNYLSDVRQFLSWAYAQE